MTYNPVLLALLISGAIAIIGDGATAQMYDYATGRGVYTRRINQLNYYSRQGQTAQDVRRILGASPNMVGENVEAYTVRESVNYYRGIQLNAGQRLIVRYGRDGLTSNWYIQR